MKKLLIALSALIVALSMVLVGCGKVEDGKITTDSNSTTTLMSYSENGDVSRTSDNANDNNMFEDDMTSIKNDITSALTDMTTLMDD